MGFVRCVSLPLCGSLCELSELPGHHLSGSGGAHVLGFLGRVAGGAVLFGRAFCGWLCPGHLVNRVLTLNPLRLGSNPVGVSNFRWAKYLALAACLTAWFVLGQPRIDVPIRVGEFWPSAWLTWKHAFPMWDLRLLITLGGVALGLVVLMCWCRFVCPFGAALELARKFSVLRFFRTEQCNDCDRCRQVCAMRTRPDEENCTNCGDCAGSCPTDCIRFGVKRHSGKG